MNSKEMLQEARRKMEQSLEQTEDEVARLRREGRALVEQQKALERAMKKMADLCNVSQPLLPGADTTGANIPGLSQRVRTQGLHLESCYSPAPCRSTASRVFQTQSDSCVGNYR
jgi:hypothetical protein